MARLNQKIWAGVAATMVLLVTAGLVAAPPFQAETRDSASPGNLADLQAAERLESYYSRVKQEMPLSATEQAEFEELKWYFEDSRGREGGLDNQGGPDGFDYFFMDNVAPDTATYSWIELRGDSLATWMPGSAFTSPDDGYSRQKVPIGFAFPFYGATYDCVRVCANGFLNFTTTTASLSNVCLPASAVNAPIIAMLWDDLHLLRGGRTDTLVVGYRNFGTYFVIEFDQVGFYSSSCPNNPMTFQAILYNNGNIKLQYNSIPIPAACLNSQTIGIQSAGTAGSPALNYVCNTTGIPPADGRAIWFFRPAGIPRPCTNLTASAIGNDILLNWTDPTLDTQGNPITVDNVQVWLGQAGTGILVATVPAGAQTYTHVNAPVGNLTYTVRPYRNPFFGTPVSVGVTMGTPSYVNDFEADGGLWEPTPETGGWGWGTPWGIANLTPHSGLNVWGTALTTNYGNSVCWQLDFDQGYAVTSPAATIEFWYWYNSQLNYDGANFKASLDNGGTWTVLTPRQGNYNVASMNAATACLGAQPGWSGTTFQFWQYAVIPVGQFLGQVPIFRFEFSSNSTTNSYPGFYFDDMTMWGLQPQAGIPQACTNLAGNVVDGNVVLTWTDPLLDTQGNPITIDSVQAWLGFAGSGTLLGTVGAGAQTFTHVNPPAGQHTYTVRPYRAPFYGAPTSIELIVGNPTYVNDFNADDGMWVPTPETGGWSWGAPTNPTAPPPHSTPSYWGTGLLANYTNSVCWQLDLNLGLVVQSPTATVEFWYRFDTELTYDGCNFKTSVDDGQTWTVMTPSQGAYTVTSISTANQCMAGQPAWSGHGQTQWQYAVIPIGSLIGQAPIFRFEFSSDPSVSNYMGFFFDDMIIWGLAQPQAASVSGTVTLDGEGGTMTSVSIRSNGLGAPTTNPAANGQYTLTGVQVGDRVIIASLTGFHADTIAATVPAEGLTGQDFVLRRTNPPAPTGLTASVNNGNGVVTLDWADSPDAQVDLYRVYRKLRADQNWALRRTANGRTNSQSLDTLTTGGIYQYRVTAVDTNVVPPAVESAPSATVETAFGALPPQMLAADTAFDNKIRLRWLDPLAPPEAELSYDTGVNGVQGIGYWSASTPLQFGWLVSKYTTQGPATITRIKHFFTPDARVGDVYQVGVFPDSTNNRPAFIVQGMVETNIPAAGDWHTVTLASPVTIPSGVFYIGARQMAPAPPAICIGGDTLAAFLPNTFFYCGTTSSGWATYESASLDAVPMQRCYVMTTGGVESELKPELLVGPVALDRRGMDNADASQSGWTAGAGFEKRVSEGKVKVSDDVIPADMPTPRAGLTLVDLRDSDRIRYAVQHPPNMTPVREDTRGRRNTLDDVIRYIIYRNGARLDSVPATTLTYDNVVGSQNENVQYTYYVTARYDNQAESPPSNTITARCGMPPGAPTALSGTPVGTTQWRLQWTDPTVNADGTPCVDLASVRIYRDGAMIGTVNPGVQLYSDTPPNPDQFYTWEVRAADEVPRQGPAATSRGRVNSPWQVVEYEWVDISQNGTDTGITGDDANGGPFDLGFAFPFYGTDYNTIRICSNGWLSFTSTVTTYSNTAIPSTAQPNCALYPFWDDLYVTSGTQWIKYFSDPANGRFIVTFHVRRLGGSVTFDFQVILSENGGIRYQYQSLDVINSATIGVENCDGTAAEQLNYNGTGDFIPAPETAVEFWGGPSGAITGIVRAFGTNQPIANTRVWAVGMPDTVVTDPTGTYFLGIEPGTYSVTFRHPNYCDTTYANVVVEDGLETTRHAVLRAPLAQFSVTSITLTTVIGQNTETSFTLSNNGGQCPLDYAISDTAGWLSVSPEFGRVNPGQAATISVRADVTGMVVGDYSADLTVRFNAAGTPRTIRVDLLLSSSVEGDDTALPTEYALHANYPNPFNAATTLRFDVPAESRVEIVLYNVTGQEVARPVSDVYAPGRHRVLFDAGDLPSGMYLMRMTAGGTVQTGKMLLLK